MRDKTAIRDSFEENCVCCTAYQKGEFADLESVIMNDLTIEAVCANAAVKPKEPVLRWMVLHNCEG